MGKDIKPCKGCSEENGEIKIKLGRTREVFLGPKCYEKAMKTSVWTVLKEDEPKK